MPAAKALRIAAVTLLCATPGCTTTQGSVALRPDGTPGPEECPEEAKRTMRALKLRVGDTSWVELDANQIQSTPIMLYDGPIESMLEKDFGTLETTTRLYGQVWTGGPQVVIRYYEAHPPDTEKLPICAVARLSMNQLRKLPESRPGIAVLGGSSAGVAIVDSFR
ncbi:serine/threonine protein kinase [Pyxidicoccus xibeiensis]|uniref:serine/threonine protein kinase n=1 Tax=Pyxidicoccus xibeiensis TaxID=2906759 RepID=UPI0020A75B9A|nr:serine/threonine protein kinase [Pyxidicoccus xibeiensis]MCP3139323.1 serine/threonine protein kinase [Pyxidicoccus xibeiensis]